MSSREHEVDIAVIVVHWNVPDLLRGCLRSIQSEISASSLLIETIVVNTGKTNRRLRSVEDEFSSVRFIELACNPGYAAGCNAGISATASSAVLLLNADTVILPGAFDILWRTLQISSHIGLVAPILFNPNGTMQSAGYRFPGFTNILFDFFPVPERLAGSVLNGRVAPGNGETPVKIDYALGAALMVRREAIESVGVFDESYFMYSEEVDYARRLADDGWTALLAPSAHIVHHGGKSTEQQPLVMYEQLWTSRARYFHRWENGPKIFFLATIVEIGTRIDDLRANAERRRANARIRNAYWNSEQK